MIATPSSSRAVPAPITPRAFSCACGRPVFFRNSECLACHRPLGYDASRGALLALEPAPVAARPARGAAPGGAPGAGEVATWREAGVPARRAGRHVRCANLDTPAACNWLLGPAEVAAGMTLCRCCRLTRTLPDLSVPEAGRWWCRIEQAKRRLVSSLIALKLPVRTRAEDPQLGLAFDLLLSVPGGPAVVTGHADGVITLDASEADDARREERRGSLGEPYRTLLGHLRHETGHYYWQLLVLPSPWLQEFRALFGDEQQDYGAALQRHYGSGAPADWGQRFVSAYASSHPWEDWAESWAHYLHLVETLDTARSFGLDGEHVELSYERFDAAVLATGAVSTAGTGGAADTSDTADTADAVSIARTPTGADADAEGFLQLINSWMELTGVLNELSRSMGVADFYPFVLSLPAVRKLYLVHRVIRSAAAQGATVP